MLYTLLSLFLKPKSGVYHDTTIVAPADVGADGVPIKNVFLIKQPNSDETIGLRIEYKIPKGCKSHHAQFVTLDSQGNRSTLLWLRAGEIEHKGTFYMMNRIDKSLVKTGMLLFLFGDKKYPTCNYYSYEIHLRDFEVA